MNATITISDADRSIDWTLAVSYDFLPGAKPHFGWRHGGHPGEPPAVEVAAVRCLEAALWCGDWALAASPGLQEPPGLERKIGAWCLDTYPDAIAEALLEWHLARQRAFAERQEE